MRNVLWDVEDVEVGILLHSTIIIIPSSHDKKVICNIASWLFGNLVNHDIESFLAVCISPVMAFTI